MCLDHPERMPTKLFVCLRPYGDFAISPYPKPWSLYGLALLGELPDDKTVRVPETGFDQAINAAKPGSIPVLIGTLFMTVSKSPLERENRGQSQV